MKKNLEYQPRVGRILVENRGGLKENTNRSTRWESKTTKEERSSFIACRGKTGEGNSVRGEIQCVWKRRPQRVGGGETRADYRAFPTKVPGVLKQGTDKLRRG